mgnify:CR=1 FL=1
MKKIKTPLKDILAWVAFFIFLIYLFLRLAGILTSPVIADLLGVGSIGYFIGVQVQKLNNQIQKLDRIVKDVVEIKQELKMHIENKEAHQ